METVSGFFVNVAIDLTVNPPTLQDGLSPLPWPHSSSYLYIFSESVVFDVYFKNLTQKQIDFLNQNWHWLWSIKENSSYHQSSLQISLFAPMMNQKEKNGMDKIDSLMFDGCTGRGKIYGQTEEKVRYD